jgi:5-methylcytosine-specific restriction endonuclease McrBC GTP-binding regulatory subunit McrB
MEVFQGWKGVDDMGRAAAEAAIRLYADKNTLFVGTMNEDETTQSLSDKVIDRANVLYFGRPNHLKAAAATGHDRGVSPYLKAETWASWVKTVEPGKFSDAEEKLDLLNRVLADLNRPFAHRTYQAMLAYVANYFAPNLAELDRINRALADQIGMRIMPKLRGIDLAQNAEVLDRVGSIVAEVGDEPLRQAFSNASDIESNKSGFFQWTGFDWH